MAAANVRSDMTRTLSDAIADEKSGKEIISELKEFVTKTGISEQEVAVLVWQCVMNAEEWNKKEDLLQEQGMLNGENKF